MASLWDAGSDRQYDALVIFIARPLFGFALASMMGLPDAAVAQEAPNSSATPIPQTSSQNAGSGTPGDVLNAQSLFQLMYQVKTAPGTGLNGAPDTVTTQTGKLRGDVSVSLSSQWVLALRGDLPFVAKNPVSDSNPEGDYLYGLGDADIQAALIRNIDDHWKAGARIPTDRPDWWQYAWIRQMADHADRGGALRAAE